MMVVIIIAKIKYIMYRLIYFNPILHSKILEMIIM